MANNSLWYLFYGNNSMNEQNNWYTLDEEIETKEIDNNKQ